MKVRSKIRREISEVQYEFIDSMGTRNAMFALHVLTERALEVRKDVY